MASFTWKPDHPLADKDGWVDKAALKEYYQAGFDGQDDMAYIDGNHKVSVHYIPDEMPATRHMIDGKYYTSKHRFRNETRARGCVEVGNETATLLKPRQRIEPSRAERRNDIKRAIYEIRNGRRIFQE